MTRPKISFTAKKIWLPHSPKGTTNLNYSWKTASLCSPKLASVNTLVCSSITRDITLNSFKYISIYNNPASEWNHVLFGLVLGKLKSISHFLITLIYHYLYICLYNLSFRQSMAYCRTPINICWNRKEKPNPFILEIQRNDSSFHNQDTISLGIQDLYRSILYLKTKKL